MDRPRKKICVHCDGRRWVDDQNWEPPFPAFAPIEREPRDGLIPCGACNFAGWDEPVCAPGTPPSPAGMGSAGGMTRPRLTPPNLPVMPAAITGPMPNGDAADPPVDAIALQAARDIVAAFKGAEPHMRITVAQLRIIDAVNEALDRCQALGGRRTK